ncbi:MAG: hypothetical protein N3F11_03530 [Casimicrobiaceae bacterium]|nr:hypothetical protein [Casimicrobiaceae bacterium]
MVFTEEAEPGRRTLLGQTMSGALTVEPLPPLGPPERWWTQRAQASEATVLRGGYRVTNDRNDRPVALRQWLEPEPIELNYTFKAFPLRSGGESLPEPFAPLYVIPYPSPFQGGRIPEHRSRRGRAPIAIVVAEATRSAASCRHSTRGGRLSTGQRAGVSRVFARSPGSIASLDTFAGTLLESPAPGELRR